MYGTNSPQESSSLSNTIDSAAHPITSHYPVIPTGWRRDRAAAGVGALLEHAGRIVTEEEGVDARQVVYVYGRRIRNSLLFCSLIVLHIQLAVLTRSALSVTSIALSVASVSTSDCSLHLELIRRPTLLS